MNKPIQKLLIANRGEIVFDIRAGYVGGEWPITGTFRLRSFHSILYFLGQALGEDPEYPVEKDPRTPAIANDENPVAAMDIVVSDSSPPDSDLSIRLHSQYYTVNTTGPLARWNRDGFQMLYLLFQMTISDIPRVGVPSITIAK